MFKDPTPTSKGNKLPKRFWKKGMSKFVEIRLHEEKCSNINELEMKFKKLENRERTWWYRLIRMISGLLRLESNSMRTR